MYNWEKYGRIQCGKKERVCFSRTREVLQMPNLIEVQKKSYQWFLDTGLREVFRDVGAITDYTGNLELTFLDYSMEEEPKYSVEECKERDATYAAPIKVRMRLRNKETGEIKEQEIFMGDFPVMTDGGTFIINGAERGGGLSDRPFSGYVFRHQQRAARQGDVHQHRYPLPGRLAGV